LGRKAGSAEFIEKYEPEFCPFLSESCHIIEIVVQ
jgi:hypothetical protein